MRFLFALCFSLASSVVSAQNQWGGEFISFFSKNEAGVQLVIPAVLWKPTTPSKGSVVLVHASNGWTEAREGHYGLALSKAGYTVMAIDTFGPRGLSSTSDNVALIKTSDMARDAFYARKYLLGLGLPADKTALAGFSRGGSAALLAADSNFLQEETDRFTVVVPFYPGCTTRSVRPKPVGQVFMLIGEKDDWSGVTNCQDWTDQYAKAGGKINLKLYPSAGHSFDGDPRYTSYIRVPTVDNYSECRVEVDDDGKTMIYKGQRFAHGTDEAVFSAMRASCVKKGATAWTNLSVKKEATKDFLKFLDETIGK